MSIWNDMGMVYALWCSSGSIPGRCRICDRSWYCRTGGVRSCNRRPSKFAKVLIMLLPGTQGIYGLLVGFITLSKIGLLGGGEADLDPKTGLLILAACLPIGIVGLISGKAQGQT